LGIDTSARDGFGRPRRLRGPTDMALDIAYELADFCRCGLGLLMLNADKRTLVVLIQKPRFCQYVDCQSSADYSDEQCDVTSE
jgi:hypothetical protein